MDRLNWNIIIINQKALRGIKCLQQALITKKYNNKAAKYLLDQKVILNQT